MTGDGRLTHWPLVFVTMAFALAMSPQPAQPTSPGNPIPLRVEVASNVFFAHVTVNGLGPFWFTVDTGATLTVIDPGAAARAKLVVRDAGRRANVGIAAGDMAMATTGRRAHRCRGPARILPRPRSTSWPVQNNAGYLRHAIDGVLGTDFLSRHIVELDYGAARVRVLAAGADRPPAVRRRRRSRSTATSSWRPPRSRCRTASESIARLLIDTGSNGALTLTSPFVRPHNLVARFPQPSSQRSRGHQRHRVLAGHRADVSRVRRRSDRPAERRVVTSHRRSRRQYGLRRHHRRGTAETVHRDDRLSAAQAHLRAAGGSAALTY